MRRTSARDRKRMLRLLIEDVTLVKSYKIQVRIRWKGEAWASLEDDTFALGPGSYSGGNRRTYPCYGHRTNRRSDYTGT